MSPSPNATIHHHTIYLADPTPPPKCEFKGRQDELELCLAAWAVDSKTYQFSDFGSRLHFCLQGPPGVGKNELVYEIARRMKRPLHIIHGHEEITPEDLSILLVPDARLSGSMMVPLVLRASPLATALYCGGLVFFDEINRVPERALAPLASVLDARQSIYSSTLGFSIEAKNEQARGEFRFCCALNPELSRAGRDLPDYIQQRLLPVIRVEKLQLGQLLEIIKDGVRCHEEIRMAFAEEYVASQRHDISLRQAMAIVSFAANQQHLKDIDAISAIKSAFKMAGLA
jgi:MoxR-like ATPase